MRSELPPTFRSIKIRNPNIEIRNTKTGMLELFEWKFGTLEQWNIVWIAGR